MANLWSPNAPASIGLEWFTTFGHTQPIALSAPSFTQQLRSRTAETITELRLAITSSPLVTAPFFMLVDVYETGDEFPVPVDGHSTVSYAPNSDVTINDWRTGPGAMGAVNLWARIDDPVTYPPTGTDYIRLRATGLSAYFGTVAASGFPATARVLRLAIEAVIGLDPDGTDFSTRAVGFGVHHNPTGNIYEPPGGTFYVTAFTPNQVLNVSLGEINPETLLPWTADDVASFDVGGDWELRVLGSNSNANGGPIVTAMSLKVSYIDPDNREACGTWQRPPGVLPQVISTDALVEPDGAGGWATDWSKPASGDFLFVPRWARATLVDLGATNATDLAWLTSHQDLGAAGNPPGNAFPPVPGMVGDILPTSSVGLPTQAFAGTSSRAARLVLRRSDATDSDDSQPYYVAFDGTVLRAVTPSQTVGQRITPNSSQSYLGVRFVIQPPASDDATLTVTVRNAATGAQIGTGQFTITADEVRALPDLGGGMRYVQGFLTSAAALVSGTQYEARLSTDASSWTLLVPAGAGASGPTFAGGSGTGSGDCARLNGTSGPSLSDQDLLLTLLVQPTAPASADALVMERTQAGGGMQCTPEAVDHVVVRWSATTLAAAFDRYEIERLEDDGTGEWRQVAVVNSAETETTFADWETPRGRAVKYRVRVVATTAAFSNWTETQWVTAEAYGAELIFTSNAAPELTVVVDYEPEVGTDFPDHEDDEVVPVYGSDRAIVFINPRDRGLEKTYRLIVSAAGRPCDDYGRPLPDDEVWEPLRAISRSVAIPYVCVMDATGNRAFVHVTLSRGQHVADDGGRLLFYWCNATTREQQAPTDPAPVSL